jgi:hypothetical protein
MKNAIDQLQSTYSENQLYHFQLDGVLSAAEINWDGEVSIIEQPEDQSILVCLVVHTQELRGFLEHFQIVNLSLDTEGEYRDNDLHLADEFDLYYEQSLLKQA